MKSVGPGVVRRLAAVTPRKAVTRGGLFTRPFPGLHSDWLLRAVFETARKRIRYCGIKSMCLGLEMRKLRGSKGLGSLFQSGLSLGTLLDIHVYSASGVIIFNIFL